MMNLPDPGLRRVVRWIAALNLGYFGSEVTVALAIGSVSLFADSIDFLEAASLNLLISLALGWSAAQRARVGILLVPDLAVGLGIAALNADAVREVWRAAREERQAATA